ncbi:MAG: nucleoside deaminase [Propionibacteriales bacterium]|nr:nucleoside deaminase [Propionibacteriales bacterium]
MSAGVQQWTSLLTAAVRESLRHVDAGGLPFVGQIVTAAGEVSPYGHNEVLDSGDPTAHAEIVAMRQVLSTQGPESLSGATLLASGEPCALCRRFADGHGVARIVYAVDSATAAQWGFDYRNPGPLALVDSSDQLHVPGELDPFIRHHQLRSRRS